QPIPEGPEASTPPSFLGAKASPKPVAAPAVPTHPLMAPNGCSTIHDDAYMIDTYSISGPLGSNMERRSTFLVSECASVVFDRAGRIVSICVGLDGFRLVMLDSDIFELIAAMPLPPRVVNIGSSNPFTDCSGGGYFY